MLLLAYLDEVQDLSHAAIFLICRLAGKDSHYWVCGGDPAQVGQQLVYTIIEGTMF